MMSSCNIPLFWSLFVLIHFSLCIKGCIESERVALLAFKNGLSDPSNRLADWVPHSSDCCNWSGVVCHNLTSHVLELRLRTLSLVEYFGPDRLYISVNEGIEYSEYCMKSALGGKVSSSLLELKHLSYLDLSFNYFGGVTIPKFIGSMLSLRYLNLSHAGFGGIIPPQLGNLSNLNFLNLGSYNFGVEVENMDWVTGLSSLKFLDFSGVNLSRSFDWLKVMNSVPSLVELHLSDCYLPGFSPNSLPNLNFSSLAVLDLSENYFGGPIPNGLQNMSSFLRELDLSWNYFNSSIPDWFYDLTHLQLLYLYANELHGQVSSRIGNLTSLVSLDLSFTGDLEFEIPNSFQNLCNLRSLLLSGVKVSQEINDVLSIMSRCGSSVLQLLDLSGCQLSGHLTDGLSYFKNLVSFDISINSISGPIPFSFGSLEKLEYVDISHNSISGPIPFSFEGEVSELYFANLTRLKVFNANGMKNDNMTLRVSSSWVPPLQLVQLFLSSWNIGPQFPKWLCLLKHLAYLDLSNSGISEPFPICFWDLLPNYSYLDFSHNHMHGSIPNITVANEFRHIIDLSSNNFSGELPCFLSNMRVLDLSHNSFSGSISNFLCNKMNGNKNMEVLNLEGNLLNGEIPDCWVSWRMLAALKLGNNFFNGNIPSSIGTLSNLESLHLRNNKLSGEVPSSIQDCTELLLLDISENNLVGKIQKWIGDGFSQLRILNLRANNFDGNLPKELCRLVSLHILVLSQNGFFGTIPNCFGNFSAMATMSDSFGSFRVNGSQSESIFLLMKGKEMEYSTNLGYVRSIDISNNNIYGEIPTTITSLVSLQSLNLSQNALTGRIPDNIGDMKGLEGIDFSHNSLSGEIPQSISVLTFLSIMDLSYNNLSGIIPSGTQLQSFNSSCFEGNHLCGPPLTNNCTSNNAPPETHIEDDDNGDEVDVWFYESAAYGFVFGFWIVVGSLVFIRNWRHFYFRSLSRLQEIIWWNLIARFR